MTALHRSLDEILSSTYPSLSDEEKRVVDDLKAIRATVRRGRKFHELTAGKTQEEHHAILAGIRDTRDGVRLMEAGYVLSDLATMTQPEPPPGVPDHEIENYGPDGKLYRMGT